MNTQTCIKNGILVVGLVCIFFLIWAHRDYFPLWDGFIYAQCFSDVFNEKSFSCANHISLGATLPMGFAMYLANDNVFSLIISNFILLLIATWVYWKIINVIFHDNKNTIESALATLIFLFQPAVVSNVIQPGLDLPLFTYYSLCIYFFLKENFLFASIVGILLVLTKEPGIGLWVALCGSYGYFFWKKEFFLKLYTKWYLILPVLIFIAAVIYRIFFKEVTLWGGNLISISHPDINLVNYLCLILIINFSWIQTFFIIMGFFHKTTDSQLKSNLWHFIILLAAMTLIVVVSYRTFSNLRYFLPFFIFLPILFYGSLIKLNLSTVICRSILFILAILLLWSNVRTIDPIAKQIYGTFHFGEHELLNMTSLSKECCGTGRDQLVYNLQFTEFDTLQQKIFQKIKPNKNTYFAVTSLTDWYTMGAIDTATFRKTFSSKNAIHLSTLEVENIISPITITKYPTSIYFIDFPNMDSGPTLKSLLKDYNIAETFEVNHHGFSLKAYHLMKNRIKSQ